MADPAFRDWHCKLDEATWVMDMTWRKVSQHPSMKDVEQAVKSALWGDKRIQDINIIIPSTYSAQFLKDCGAMKPEFISVEHSAKSFFRETLIASELNPPSIEDIDFDADSGTLSAHCEGHLSDLTNNDMQKKKLVIAERVNQIVKGKKIDKVELSSNRMNPSLVDLILSAGRSKGFDKPEYERRFFGSLRMDWEEQQRKLAEMKEAHSIQLKKLHFNCYNDLCEKCPLVIDRSLMTELDRTRLNSSLEEMHTIESTMIPENISFPVLLNLVHAKRKQFESIIEKEEKPDLSAVGSFCKDIQISDHRSLIGFEQIGKNSTPLEQHAALLRLESFQRLMRSQFDAAEALIDDVIMRQGELEECFNAELLKHTKLTDNVIAMEKYIAAVAERVTEPVNYDKVCDESQITFQEGSILLILAAIPLAVWIIGAIAAGAVAIILSMKVREIKVNANGDASFHFRRLDIVRDCCEIM